MYFLLQNYVTYREFLLYLEEYQKTNISDLKTRKIQTKPTPPNSPPKDSSLLSLERIRADCNKNRCCIDSHLLGINYYKCINIIITVMLHIK